MKSNRTDGAKGASLQTKKLTELPRDRGFAADGLEAGPEPAGGEDMEQVVSMLGDVDIDFADSSEEEAAPTPEKRNEEWQEEAQEVEEERSVSESADPVRMYLQEMGAVPLLSREDEVSIAKGIEAGEKEVRAAVFGLDIAVKYVIGLGDALRNGEIDARQVFGDEETEAEEEGAEQRDDARTKAFLRQVTRLKRLASDREKVDRLLGSKARVSKTRRERLLKRRGQLGKAIEELLDVTPIGKFHITSITEKLKEADQVCERARRFAASQESRSGKSVAELMQVAQRLRTAMKSGGKPPAVGVRRMTATQVIEVTDAIREARRAAAAAQRELGFSGDELRDVLRRIWAVEAKAQDGKKRLIEANLRLVVSIAAVHE